MTLAPEYFELVRERASRRWDQLEHDPELAGPWHQLFKQVQSPSHVLSELLQNADDAQATSASVWIEDGHFIFSHNGVDFTEEHFSSLCRFGYSNKRALHTIGFRGIGFKSTFSLGDTVELRTPTLSVMFSSRRFTEPIWVDPAPVQDGFTQVRVRIADEHRKYEIERNLNEWRKSRASLLFFRNLRALRIHDQELRWESQGNGPVPKSEWTALDGDPDRRMLIISSDPEEFPFEALEEIRQERLISSDEDADFPPCEVQIVMNEKGQLYVVLPTGVETALPFACNAPFIQDPARLKIKDPEISPTNRWLLERIGRLAGSSMLAWLEGTTDRANAYGLMPDADRDDSSPGGKCAAIVALAFADAIAGRSVLLDCGGSLRKPQGCIAVPKELLDVWPHRQVSSIVDEEQRPVLSREVSPADLQKLRNWRLLSEITMEEVVDALRARKPPRPRPWRKLLRLWAYLSPEFSRNRSSSDNSAICIVPIQGSDSLHPAANVVRLGENRLLQSESDRQFIAEHLQVMNQKWTNYLAEQSQLSAQQGSDSADDIAAARSVLRALGLSAASDAAKVVEKIASSMFSLEGVGLAHCVRLAQIAAKLGVPAGPSFRFVTRDQELRPIGDDVLYDECGDLEYLLPRCRHVRCLLDTAYSRFESCSKEDWAKWILSSRVGIHTFPPLTRKSTTIPRPTRNSTTIRRDDNLREELRKRGWTGWIQDLPFQNREFRITEWDFDSDLWSHWRFLCDSDNTVWSKVVDHILERSGYLSGDKAKVVICQISKQGTEREIGCGGGLLPPWILKFREVPCLPDTRGLYNKPTDLLRRTLETEALMDVEPFISSTLDTEANRPLLDLLGVRRVPMGPDGLLERLRALARSDAPPVNEVDKWYRRLDHMLQTCSTIDAEKIGYAFRTARLVLTEAGDWAKASGVFILPDDEGMPGAPVVRASVRDLQLWRRLEVLERPTGDLAIKWLKSLHSGAKLSDNDVHRVRSLLPRFPHRIWTECGHWLNLLNEWSPADRLELVLTMQSLVAWSHLDDWVKRKTADCQLLKADVTSDPPFSALSPLSARIEEQLLIGAVTAGAGEKRPWLGRLSFELSRVELESSAETDRVRELGRRLSQTLWQTAPDLHVLPYLDGIPVGTSRPAEVAWIEDRLYTADLPNARLARIVPERLSSAFGRPDISAALNYCYGRSSEDVSEYFEGNFKLSALEAPVQGTSTEEARDSGENEAEGTGGENNGEGDLQPATPPHDGSASGEDADDDASSEPPSSPGPRTHKPHHVRPTGPSVMERFALLIGFSGDAEEQFAHPDGRRIVKDHGSDFKWKMIGDAGDTLHHYWPKEHCLENEDLELATHVWRMIDEFPDTHSLVLSDAEGYPVEYTGASLRDMNKAGRLTLFPATYRLKYDRGDK